MSTATEPGRKTCSDKKRASNRKNSRASTGPNTRDGKRRSSMNARKHGMTGAGVALSPEDQAAFDARLAAFDDDIRPRGAVEEALVFTMALSISRLERSAKQEGATLSRKCRDAPAAWDREVQGRVQELGKLLLDDPVPRVDSDLIPDRDAPKFVQWRLHEPAVLVMELKDTLQGCDYLIERWKEVRYILSNEGYWHFDAKLKAVRMLGKRPEAVLYDLQIGDIFACCALLHPEEHEHRLRWDCMQAGFTTEARPMYYLRIEKLAERTPMTRQDAINHLLDLADGQIIDLQLLREDLIARAELDRAEAPMRAAFDDSKQGELRRRYEVTNGREFHRSLAALVKLRASGVCGESEAGLDPPAPPEPIAEPEVVAEDASGLAPAGAAPRNEAIGAAAAPPAVPIAAPAVVDPGPPGAAILN